MVKFRLFLESVLRHLHFGYADNKFMMTKIDLSYLELVSDGDKDFVQDFIHTFEYSSYPLVGKMKNHFESNDFEMLSKSAHQLKPSVKMLQLECSDTVEGIQHNPNLASNEVLEQIKIECLNAISELKTWAKSL